MAWRSGLLGFATCLGLLMFAGCADTLLIAYVGSPFQRFDHNRTRPLSAEGVRLQRRGNCAQDLLCTRHYTPYSSASAADVTFLDNRAETDGLPSGRVTATFSGVALPLSKAPPSAQLPDARSDFDDLLDFLGSGAGQAVGVLPARAVGKLPEQVAREFGAVLGLLSSAASLASDAALDAWIDRHNLPQADLVMDARFDAISSFSRVVALECHSFWFVLYRVKNREDYTRLVVVPAEQLRREGEVR